MLHRILLFALFVALVPVASSAQPPILNELLQRQNQILQENRERQREFEEQFQTPTLTTPSIDVPLLPLEAEGEGGGCLEVARLDIQGVTLLPSRRIKELSQEYENRCLGLADINNIARRLTNMYTAMGYVTSRAFIEPQDISTGTLVIVVVEGTLEDIVPGEQSGIDPRQLVTIFPGMRGKVLNLRDIEQGLDQLNRLSSRNASMQILPGEEFGSSILLIDDTPAKSWIGSLGMDNMGQVANGEYQHTVSLTKDNFIGCFDQLSLSFNFDAPRYGAQVNKEARGFNQSFNSYFSIPYGYWSMFFSANVMNYSTDVDGFSRTYTLNGGSRTFKFGIDRVIHRDAHGKTTIGFSTGTHDVDSFMEGLKLFSSSYFISTVTASLSHTRRILGGVLSGRVEATLGVPWYGALRDEDRSRSIPRRQFRKWYFSAQWHKPLFIGRQYFSWETSVSAQLSDHTLYGAERFSIGSLYTVRGYSGSPLTGDQGMTIRNTLTWNIPVNFTGPWIRNLQLYAGYDWGKIFRDREDPYEQGHLRGMALGMRTGGKFSLDCAWGYPLSAPSWVRKTPGVFTATIRYSF